MSTRRLCVGIDSATKEDFFRIYDQLSDLPLVFKLGLRMLPKLEQSDWKKFAGKSIFVDAKLHDIPTQVSEAVKSYVDLGASFITLHLSGGRKMLEAAAKACPSTTRLLGVSVLTSLAQSDLEDIGFAQGTEASVLKLVDLGMQSGVNSFVSSAFEVPEILKKHPRAFLATPGLTLNGVAHLDQQRSLSLEEALTRGTSMPIIARAIIEDRNPRSRAEEALSLLNRK